MARDCIAFKARFPDDAQFDPHGQLIVPRGKAIMNSLAGTLARKGCPVGQVRQYGTHGWGMEMSGEGFTFLCLLQSKGPLMVLVVAPRLSLFARLFSGKRAAQMHAEMMETIGKVVSADARFSEVRILAREELGSA